LFFALTFSSIIHSPDQLEVSKKETLAPLTTYTTYTFTTLKMADNTNNNQQQPGLIGSHAQYVKGAAEASSSPIHQYSLANFRFLGHHWRHHWL
jgi:hypothetical protein